MKIVVYGAGMASRRVLNSIKLTNNEIVALVDSNIDLEGKLFEGIAIQKPDILNNLDYDVVIIGSVIFYEDIREILLKEFNVPDSKIKRNGYLSALNLLTYYEEHQDSLLEDMVLPLEYIKKNENMSAFNYAFADEILKGDVEVLFDNEEGLYYGVYNNKRLYFSKKYNTLTSAKRYFQGLLLEQDVKSPHRYIDSYFYVGKDDIVLDGGAAEGNFALDIIEDAKKVILVEADEEWIRPLELTFAPYKHKVVIINKSLSDICDDKNITIDEIYTKHSVNCIKLDIEGGEVLALQCAKHLLNEQNNLKLAVCSYHNFDDEHNLRMLLESYNYVPRATGGYINFMESMQEPKLFVRALLKVCSNS